MKAKKSSKKKGARKTTAARKTKAATKGARKKGTRKQKTATTPVGDIMRNAAEVIESLAKNIRPVEGPRARSRSSNSCLTLSHEGPQLARKVLHRTLLYGWVSFWAARNTPIRRS